MTRESAVERLRREIKLNAVVFRLLAARQVPYLVMYGPDGRTIEARTSLKGLSLLIKTTPIPDKMMVLLIIKPTGMKPFIEEVDECILDRRLHYYFGKILS